MRHVLPILLLFLSMPALAKKADKKTDPDAVEAAEGQTPTDLPGSVTESEEKQKTTTGDEFGDDDDKAMNLRMLLQTRYGQTWPTAVRPGERAQAQHDDGWNLWRAFVRASAKPTKWISGKILLDFASLRDGNPVQAVKQAYAEVEPFDRLKVTAGLFKRSFSLLELLPIADYEFADTGLADTLIQDTGFGGRDAGVMVSVSPLPKKKWLKAHVGAFQGGHIVTDARPDGLLTARLESTPIKHLHLGADMAWRRLATDPNLSPVDGQQGAGWAWSADAMLQYPEFEVRAEVLGGDRTDLDHRLNPDLGLPALHFLGAWLVGAVHIPIRTWFLMPAVRAEWLDTDTDRPTGNHLALSGALDFDFDKRVRLVLDLTKQWVENGTIPVGHTPQGAKDLGNWSAFHDSDWLRFVAQLQVKL